jgi:glycosyltransferase involved in cell wall biosynthesis
MRILHVIETIDPAAGGPVEAVRQLACFAGHGVDAEIVTLDETVKSWSSAISVPVHALGPGLTQYRYSGKLVPWLRANVGRFDAAVVHGVWHYHLIGVWRALRRSDLPYFVIPHGMLHPWFKRTYPAKHVKKSIFFHAMVHPALKQAAAVVFLCPEEQYLAHLAFKLRVPRECVAPLGLDDDRLAASAGPLDGRFPELRNKRIVLFLSRIHLMKNCEGLIRGFCQIATRHPEIHLLLAGPDQEGREVQLRQLAERLGAAQRITFSGPLYGSDKVAALRTADLVALPSHCETFPVIVLEALAAGKPVLVSDAVCIFRDIVESGAGLVSSTDSRSIAAQLERWATMELSARHAMSIQARRCFLEKFTLRSAVQQHLRVICETTNIEAMPSGASR